MRKTALLHLGWPGSWHRRFGGIVERVDVYGEVVSDGGLRQVRRT